jgi:hypothetical protein
MAVPDKRGWYVLGHNSDPRTCLDWQYRRRPRWLDRDINSTIHSVDRTLYSLTSWKDPSLTDSWQLAQKRDGNWVYENGEKPTPNVEDIRAISVWGDIDLADDLKQRRGSLSAQERSTIKRALEEYAIEFSRIYGGLESIYMLDSVGGAYAFGPPEATLPIAQYYSDDLDGRARVFDALIERSNEWLEEAQERVEKRVQGAAELLDPDWVNNINRAYKTPLSIHSQHDAVVRPLNPAKPTLSVITVDEVGQDHIDRAQQWAQDLTSIRYEDRVENLVAQLWSDYFLECGDWRETLDSWLQDERENEVSKTTANPQVADDPSPCRELTTDVDETRAALDRIDVKAVAERTIVHRWTDSAPGVRDNSSDGKRALIPTWGPDAEGTANYVDLESNTWTDTGADDHGTVVEMALIDRENWPRGRIAEGDDWGRGLTHLQRLGFDVPVWTPDATSQGYSQMPWWAIRRAAVVLGVVNEEDIISNPTPDDNTTFGFPSESAFNQALDAISETGLRHNREKAT